MKLYSGYLTVKFKNVLAEDEEWLRDWLEEQIELESDCSIEIDDVDIHFEEPYVPIEEGK